MNKSDLTSYIDTLSACRLFTGIDEQNLPAMLTCLDGNHIHVKKGNPIFVEGDPARFIGIILTGTAQVIREDYYGQIYNPVICLQKPSPAQVFLLYQSASLP